MTSQLTPKGKKIIQMALVVFAFVGVISVIAVEVHNLHATQAPITYNTYNSTPFITQQPDQFDPQNQIQRKHVPHLKK